jgi:hypothetical protein
MQAPRTEPALLIVPPHHLSRAAGGAWTRWSYLGTDLAQRDRVARAWPALERVSIGEPLNRIAHQIKPAFLDWVAALGQRQPRASAWCATKLASKSPVQTDLFALVCYAELAAAWADAGERRVVVVEDPWLLLTLRRRLQGAGAHVELDRWALVRDVASTVVRAPWASLLTLWWAGRLRIAARRHVPAAPPSQWPDTFLYTWVLPHCFDAEGRLSDPYLGRLDAILRAQGRRVGRLTPLRMAEPLVRRLAGPSDVLVAPALLRWRDIAAACVEPVGIAARGAERWRGWHLGPLLARETLREWADPSARLYRLSFRAFRRIAALGRGRVARLVYPFENQPWEKQLLLAYRQASPDTRLVGCQHGSVGPLWLSYALGQGETDWCPLPDWIMANGPLAEARLRASGFPADRVRNAGSLRFDYLFAPADVASADFGVVDVASTGHAPTGRTPGDRSSAATPPTQPRQVLVGLSFSAPHVVALLRALREAFPTADLDGDDRVAFLLKWHPALPPQALRPALEPLPAWMTATDRPLRALFAQAELFLYVPPTISCWEAYAAGLPVLKFADDLLDVDALDGLDDDAQACTAETLRAQVIDLLRRGPAAPEAHRRALSRVFSPVDEQLWAEVLR